MGLCYYDISKIFRNLLSNQTQSTGGGMIPMTKKMGTIIVFLAIFAIVLSGCNRPASKGPMDTPEEQMTTPIIINTESSLPATQTEVAKYVSTATLLPAGETVVPPTSTPEPTEVIAIPTITAPEEYTVQAGETIYCLARRFDVDPNDILSANNSTGSLYPGDVLVIPQNSKWPGESRSLMDHPDTYTVVAGDTIYSIACDYGDVSPEAIIAVNQLEEPYELTAGQTLSIP
jgi:LysM repeat protein